MKKLTVKFVFLLSLILSGCQTFQTTTEEATTTKSIETVMDELVIEQVPIVRHGRFTLVEVNQVGDEQNLLSRIVEVFIPKTFKQPLTVKDGLNYLLLGSGYRLCHASSINTFSKLPLPTAHYHIGPVSLHSALKILTGPTWQMQVDQHNRVICFTPNPDIELNGVTGVTEVGRQQP